jgi:TatA/E family protein of Tat protein translocase
MFGLQPTHLLIILVVALLFFVPSRLPELGRALRQTIVELRTAFKEIAQESTVAPHDRIDSKK